MKNVNYKLIIANTILNTQYITKGRLEKFLKVNDYVKGDKFDCYDVFNNALDNNTEKIIFELQEYEYQKSYKYFSFYKINSKELITKLVMIEEHLNQDSEDYLSNKVQKPTMREFKDEIDIKFTLTMSDKSSGKTIKYPIIATIFKNIDLLIIKYCSISEEFYESEFYININKSIKRWIEKRLTVELEEFDSMDIFEKLHYSIRINPDKHKNESIHSILRDDEMNGRTFFRASDMDMLPFIDDLLNMANSFDSKNDKTKLLNYVERYEKESIVRNIAIKWKHRFSNSRGKLGKITISISKVYSIDNKDNKPQYEFILHHIHQSEGINRERINYVINYISNYSKENQG